MKYQRITTIKDPLFAKMHQLMQHVFPPEEVLEFSLWEEPLEDPDIHVYVAVYNQEVVGATEYRYYKQFQVAMTDFTIIGREGLGIGRFLAKKRGQDLQRMAQAEGQQIRGMFAEIYDPYRVPTFQFGGVKPMDPFVRREVLSHLGYCRLDVDYVHPSWNNDGEAVGGLDLCFLPYQDQQEIPSKLVAQFLETYYQVLPNKPQQWLDMVQALKQKENIALLPI